MKKIFSLLAVFLLTLTCGVLLTGCFGDGGSGGNERQGEKCYITVDRQNGNPFYDKGVNFMYGTNYGGIDNWIGIDGDLGDSTSMQEWFIKGDNVWFKLWCDAQFYYADDDLKLTVNNQPIALTASEEVDEEFPDRVYYTCNYTIQEDITVSFTDLKERSASITLTAQTRDEIAANFDEDDPVLLDNLINANYIMDNSIKVRFEDKDVFNLDKAEWGLNELREYLTIHEVVGENIGVRSGTNVYVYSEGYTINCPHVFTILDNEEGEVGISAMTEYFCYINEQENEYGFKINIRPDYTSVPGGETVAKDGAALLSTFRRAIRENEIYGNMPDRDYVGYQFYATIDEVKQDNSVFVIKYGGHEANAEMQISDFSDDGKLDVQITLMKYNTSTEWKNLCNNMNIRIGDIDLVNGEDYTISPSGIIDLTLDRPYEYFDLDVHGDCPEYYSGEILGDYMYTYFFYLDIIERAKDAGLIVPINHDYFTPGCVKVMAGGQEILGGLPYGYYDCVIGFTDKFEEVPKALVVKTDSHKGMFGDGGDYTKVRVTYGNGQQFTVNITAIKFSVEELNDSYGQMMWELGQADYVTGKECVAFKAYASDEGGDYISAYYFKVQAGLNVSRIEFL